MRRRAKPAKVKAEAKRPLVRKAPATDAARVLELEKRLAEALEREKESLEQQTATSEILSAISSSPTDVQPVFDTIARSARRLCGGNHAGVFIYDGELVHIAALDNVDSAATEAFQRVYPTPPSRAAATTRAIVERTIVEIPDVLADPSYAHGAAAQAAGMRSIAAVPMLRNENAVGVITVARPTPGAFSEREISFLRTFADQAVIAIENVRLLTELGARNRDLTEALEQQTATSAILRVIARSPTDVQPILDTIVQNAGRVCGAEDATLFLADGSENVLRAYHGARGIGTLPFGARLPLTRETINGRAVLDATPIHVHDIKTADDFPLGRKLSADLRFHTALAVPLVREDRAFGSILIRRIDVRPFSDKHIELLKTFADQAVIAIENVRLFTELQTSNRDLTTALDTQTATGDILRVISRSQTDVQPVFDAIVASAVRLLHAYSGTLTRRAGDQIELAALTSTDGAGDATLRAAWPQSLQSEGAHAQAIRDRAPLNVADAHTDPRVAEYVHATARARGYRSLVVVPLLRHDEAVGAISVTRREPGGFTDDEIALLQTFADQAVIAIENVRLFTELQTSNRELTTALDHRTATAEVLGVISRSYTDVQPVFQAIVDSAKRLLRGNSAVMSRVVVDHVELAAYTHTGPTGDALLKSFFPTALHSDTGVARQIRDGVIGQRMPYNVADMETDPRVGERGRANSRARGYRSQLVVPMIRDEDVVGTIAVTRPEPSAFRDEEITLLQTFAEQAVIAIENVRLFTELQQKNEALTQAHAQVTEALEQQTATSEILKIISRSPTDIQPVLDAVAMNAAVVCGASDAIIMRAEPPNMRRVAHFGPIPLLRAPVRPLAEQSSVGHAIVECRVIHLHDISAPEALREFPDNALAAGAAWRTQLTVPLARDGRAIGAITIRRTEVRPFTEKQIALLQTFADQAVIAIENVRLFTELQASNRDLTTALDTQTATSDILRVISGSRTDVQPVFDAIVQSAVRLLGAYSGLLTRVAGDQIELAAITSTDDAGDAAMRASYPQSLHSEGSNARAIRDRAPVNIADAQTDPRLPEAQHATARARGYRGIVTVPMLRRDEAIGAIAVTRREAGGFADDEIALLQTFADQAVIAIENARLLGELQARTEDLTRTVGELRALTEIGQAIGSTLDLETVLATIVARATELTGADAGVIYEYDAQREVFERRATERLEAEIVQALVATPIRRGQGVTGQLERVRAPIQQAEIGTLGEQLPVRDALVQAGYRSLLAVPLLHEDHLIGGLTVFRKSQGEFAANVVELLQTFATQSALAIQNARLFREIEIKSRELEVASQHKSEFLASMSHELRTPLNAIIGFSDVLLQGMFGETNEKQAEYLQDILASGEHLLSLINDILDLSKIEAGRMELDAGDFNLPAAIDDAMLLMRERAGRRGIVLERRVDERVGEIRADPRKVKQVLLNLLSNAVKFTPEGGRITVSAALAANVVELSVTDTGVGIAPEDHEAVFEEFRQVGHADKKAEGTGLGLALCRKFVELHGGRIWVKSQLGAGSTFTFSLPVSR